MLAGGSLPMGGLVARHRSVGNLLVRQDLRLNLIEAAASAVGQTR
jgi:hypothetical protein